jgi:hypothetical protein
MSFALAPGITWNRKQLKAVGQLLSHCGRRAYDFGAEEITVASVKETLEPFYKEIEEGTFGKTFNDFNSLCLDECKDILSTILVSVIHTPNYARLKISRSIGLSLSTPRKTRSRLRSMALYIQPSLPSPYRR